uniref:Ribonuclease A-domain domain-containing protein n=1 Tax=Neolamprologus brichardi TaxID=32507 RepID=A0A3Q4GFH3_NEOBR
MANLLSAIQSVGARILAWLLGIKYLVQSMTCKSKRQNETPYEKFKRQHVDAKMTAKKCDAEIKNKQIYNVDNTCKDTNTFILSDYEKVKAICNGHGSPYENTCLTESKNN